MTKRGGLHLQPAFTFHAKGTERIHEKITDCAGYLLCREMLADGGIADHFGHGCRSLPSSDGASFCAYGVFSFYLSGSHG